MKIKLMLIGLSFAAKLSAQVKSVVKFNNTSNIKEAFFVLQSDKSVKEGNYTASLFSGDNIINGYYHNNLKDSVWAYYSGKNLLATGKYNNGEKIGLWSGYNLRGQLQVQYNYSEKKLSFYKPSLKDSTRQYLVKTDSELKLTTLDRCPVYLNGNAWFVSAMNRLITYPASARQVNRTGLVIIAFMINEDGSITDYSVEKKVGAGLDEEAMRVVKVVNEDQWLPGMLNGKPVAVKYMVPVSFAIQTINSADPGFTQTTIITRRIN